MSVPSKNHGRGVEVHPTGASGQSPARKILVLSGNGEDTIRRQLQNFKVHSEAGKNSVHSAVTDHLAYAPGHRRSLLPDRAENGAQPGNGAPAIHTLATRSLCPPTVAFVYTGQGAQWHSMGRELMDTCPVFARYVLLADQCISGFGAGFSIIRELSKDAASSSVSAPHVSQPACTAIQIALTEVLRAFGVQPTAVIGHSGGEIGAAYAAGIIGLDDAMSIAYWIGAMSRQLEHSGKSGAMLAVGGGEEEVKPYLQTLTSGQVVIACINSDSSVTVSGDESAIDELQTLLKQESKFCSRLPVSVAYHSHHMQSIADAFRSHIEHVSPQESQTSFYSSVYGHATQHCTLGPDYWVANLVHPVRFCKGVRCLLKERSISSFIEVGPHPALAGSLQQILKADGFDADVTYTPTLRRNQNATTSLLKLADSLWTKGFDVDLEEVDLSCSE